MCSGCGNSRYRSSPCERSSLRAASSRVGRRVRRYWLPARRWISIEGWKAVAHERREVMAPVAPGLPLGHPETHRNELLLGFVGLVRDEEIEIAQMAPGRV